MDRRETNTLDLVNKTKSLENATKYLWRLRDGKAIESVILEHENMTCACISSQVGCPLDCVYCATGKLDFARSLTVKEITEQVSRLEAELQSTEGENSKLWRVLFMGMGEPLLNYRSVIESAILIHNEAVSDPTEVFLATSGSQPEKINELAVDAPFIKLWITLCAVDDNIRAKLMPAASGSSIKDILRAGEAYAKKIGRPTRINYLMIDGLTDTRHCMEELVMLLAGRPFKLQLSRLNPTPDSSLLTSSTSIIREFADFTTRSSIPTSLFMSKGIDVMAGCGQLAPMLKSRCKTS